MRPSEICRMPFWRPIDVMQSTQVLGAQILWFRAFPQVSEFLPYPRGRHMAGTLAETHAVSSAVARWPSCLSEDSRRRPRSPELVSLGLGADGASCCAVCGATSHRTAPLTRSRSTWRRCRRRPRLAVQHSFGISSAPARTVDRTSRQAPGGTDDPHRAPHSRYRGRRWKRGSDSPSGRRVGSPRTAPSAPADETCTAAEDPHTTRART